MNEEDKLDAIHAHLIVELDPDLYELSISPPSPGFESFISIRQCASEDSGDETIISWLGGVEYLPFSHDALTYIAVQIVKAAEKVEQGLSKFLKRYHQVEDTEGFEVCYVLDMAKRK